LPQRALSYDFFMGSSAYHLTSLSFYRECVEAALARDIADTPTADVAFADIHIASSCLQKALRRGDFDFALSAARLLLRADPERLWRRLCVCVFEDFGLSDLSVTARVVAVAGNRGFRLVQGEERVLSHLLGLLCTTPKDRRLDDLYGLGAAVLADNGRLKGIKGAAPNIAPLVHEASRLMAGCERAVPRRAFRAVSNEASVRALARMAADGLVDAGLFELCAKGVRLSRCLLPVLLPLAIAATEAMGGVGTPTPAPIAAVPLVGGVPAYVLDGFTRLGRTALARLFVQEQSLQILLVDVPAAKRLDVLHHLLFVAEGSQCSPLISDVLSETLRSEAIACAGGLTREGVVTGVALIGQLAPALHDLRKRIISRQEEDLS
jgi:hypothetical protein